MSSVVSSIFFQNHRRNSTSGGRAPVVPPHRLISQPTIIVAVLVLDALAVVLAGAATYGSGRVAANTDDLGFLALAGVAGGVLAVLGARWAYTIRALCSAARQAFEIALGLVLSLAGFVVCEALAGAYAPDQRSWLLDWFLAALALCVATRLVVARLLARWSREGRLGRRAVVVGGGDATTELIQRLDRTASDAIQILGLFDDRDKLRSPEQVGGYCKLGRFDDLVEFCRAQRVDLLIVALPPSAEDRILELLKQLWVLPIDVRVAALGGKLKLASRAYNYIGEAPFLPLFDKPMSDGAVALKIIEDRVLATIALVLLAPVMALVAIAVKLDSRGPVLFKQIRYGFNNEKIEVYKFRSMYIDQADADAVKAVTRGDPRVTRVGRFIRKTSLDELPQLFNVAFKGNLALVGPRPHAVQGHAENRLYDEVVDGYFARHRVKPGITGWAQINGWRGETDTAEKIEQRVAHDLFYIENWSMLFDLRILALTPLSLVTTKNAY
ncbi:MAG: undecaprenyl-phosphate glucose phosphotransferase [Methylocystis sp.]